MPLSENTLGFCLATFHKSRPGVQLVGPIVFFFENRMISDFNNDYRPTMINRGYFFDWASFSRQHEFSSRKLLALHENGRKIWYSDDSPGSLIHEI